MTAVMSNHVTHLSRKLAHESKQRVIAVTESTFSRAASTRIDKLFTNFKVSVLQRI